MALHHELPIYKDAYGLFSLVLKITRNFPRDVKQILGKSVLDECAKLMTLVFRANVARDKVPHIEELQERLQVVEQFLRASRDERFITPNQYANAIKFTDSIGRQSSGWKKQSATAPAM